MESYGAESNTGSIWMSPKTFHVCCRCRLTDKHSFAVDAKNQQRDDKRLMQFPVYWSVCQNCQRTETTRRRVASTVLRDVISALTVRRNSALPCMFLGGEDTAFRVRSLGKVWRETPQPRLKIESTGNARGIFF